jgi:hypothetical protein
LPLVPVERELEAMWRAFHGARAAGRIAMCVAVMIDGWERLADVLMRERSRESLDALVRARAQPVPPVVAHVGDRVWIVATAADVREAEAFARELVHAGRRHRLRISVGIGMSSPGVRFEVWLRVAEEGLAIARNAGGDRAVHTEIYELIERQLAGAALPISARDAELVPIPDEGPNLVRSAAPAHRTAEPLRLQLPEDAARRIDDAETARELRPPDGSRLELLERRIDKLSHALESFDARLARLERRRGERGDEATTDGGDLRSEPRAARPQRRLAPALDPNRRAAAPVRPA